METSRSLRGVGRGALLGVALVACTTALADEAIREHVQRQYRHQSYLLVEFPGEPPRLFLLTADRDAATPAEPVTQPIGRALEDLAHPDPDVREEAVLTLGDLGAGPALLTAMLDDPSADVREAAAAVLEDLAAAEE